MRRHPICVAIMAVGLVLTGCGGDGGEPKKASGKAAEAPTNRIDLPASVRQNLGITWAEAKRGRLETVERVPGEIVVRPDRDWHLRAPLAGTLTRIAAPWTRVESGEVVVRIASPALAQVQAELYAARERAEVAKMDLAQARAVVAPERAFAETRERAAKDAAENVARIEGGLLEAERVAAAAARRLEEVKRLQATEAISAAALLTARRETLEATRTATQAMTDLNAARVHAGRLALDAATTRARVEAADARLSLLATRLASAESAFDQRLSSLAALSGTTSEALRVVEGGVPAWARLREFEMRAPGVGVVAEVDAAAGRFVDQDEELIRIVDSSTLMFRAHLPEGDVGRFPVELEATVSVPGTAGSFSASGVALRALGVSKTRSVVLEALLQNPAGRLRPGTSATALVVTSRAAGEEVIVPVNCVVRDGLESVVFKRDAANQDQVVRTVVSLGTESGGWVEVIAGVGTKEQLVLEGVHQLRATGLGKAAAGGHFHADGTWHEGDD